MTGYRSGGLARINFCARSAEFGKSRPPISAVSKRYRGGNVLSAGQSRAQFWSGQDLSRSNLGHATFSNCYSRQRPERMDWSADPSAIRGPKLQDQRRQWMSVESRLHTASVTCIESPRPFQVCCQILPPRFNAIPSVLAGRTPINSEGSSLCLLPISIELLEKCDKIIGLLLVLQTRIDHLRARNLRFWIPDIFPERRFIPGNPRIFVGIRI